MARVKMRTFVVSYRLTGGETTEQDTVEAHDEACALGCVLDEHDDDVTFDWVHIADSQAALPLASELAELPTAVTALPPAIERAYQAALASA